MEESESDDVDWHVPFGAGLDCAKVCSLERNVGRGLGGRGARTVVRRVNWYEFVVGEVGGTAETERGS